VIGVEVPMGDGEVLVWWYKLLSFDGLRGKKRKVMDGEGLGASLNLLSLCISIVHVLRHSLGSISIHQLYIVVTQNAIPMHLSPDIHLNLPLTPNSELHIQNIQNHNTVACYWHFIPMSRTVRPVHRKLVN
jgi:hypothetical protein